MWLLKNNLSGNTLESNLTFHLISKCNHFLQINNVLLSKNHVYDLFSQECYLFEKNCTFKTASLAANNHECKVLPQMPTLLCLHWQYEFFKWCNLIILKGDDILKDFPSGKKDTRIYLKLYWFCTICLK